MFDGDVARGLRPAAGKDSSVLVTPDRAFGMPAVVGRTAGGPLRS